MPILRQTQTKQQVYVNEISPLFPLNDIYTEKDIKDQEIIGIELTNPRFTRVASPSPYSLGYRETCTDGGGVRSYFCKV